MMKRLCMMVVALLWASAALAQPPVTVTVTGTIYDNYGQPSVGTCVGIGPINPTAQGADLIMSNPVQMNTDSGGNFTLKPVGGIYAAFYVWSQSCKHSGGVPTTVILTTLPDSGVVTLSQLLAQQSNVVTSFPPNGNLNMNFFTFLNLAGATIVGNPVVEGAGLSGGSIFTSSGTFTVPVNTTYIVATLFAGGGGGGGGYSATYGGGGGGGGELVQCMMLPVNGTVTVTIGTGGTGGTVTNTGAAATDTTVSQMSATTICDAGGGAGGIKGTSGGAGAGGSGGNASPIITGAAVLMFNTLGHSGGSGSGATGGTGAGLGQFGGNGGPAAGPGLAGANGLVLMRSF